MFLETTISSQGSSISTVHPLFAKKVHSYNQTSMILVNHDSTQKHSEHKIVKEIAFGFQVEHKATDELQLIDMKSERNSHCVRIQNPRLNN